MTKSPAQKQTRIPQNSISGRRRGLRRQKRPGYPDPRLDPVDSGLTDFFLVTSAATSGRPSPSPTRSSCASSANSAPTPNSVEGRRNGEWILLDYVDFVVHVFLAERRAFYDIERLRKSARPLTPAEFDAELKAALAEKTRAVRKKAAAKPKPREVRQAQKRSPRQPRKSQVKKKAARPAKPGP